MRFLATILTASLLLSAAISPACLAKEDTDAFVTNSVEINASSKAVWEALRKHRTVTPGRKLLSYKNGQALMNEKFENLPVIGNADVTYVEEESPMELNYHLIRSDKLKQFEGKWKLSPTDGGKHTLLELSAHTDSGMRVPFSGIITKNNTRKRSEQRLAEIKHLAESQATM